MDKASPVGPVRGARGGNPAGASRTSPGQECRRCAAVPATPAAARSVALLRPLRLRPWPGSVLSSPVTFGQQLVHLLHDARREGVHRWVWQWPALVDDELADVRGQRGGAEGHDPPVRMAVYVYALPTRRGRRINNGRDVFVLSSRWYSEASRWHLGLAGRLHVPRGAVLGTGAGAAIASGRPAPRGRARAAVRPRSSSTQSRCRP
jgi:hypothetical protein